MNTETLEPVETAPDKDILQTALLTANEVTEVSNFVEPEKVKISIPIKTQKGILERYTGFMNIPLKVKG